MRISKRLQFSILAYWTAVSIAAPVPKGAAPAATPKPANHAGPPAVDTSPRRHVAESKWLETEAIDCSAQKDGPKVMSMAFRNGVITAVFRSNWTGSQIVRWDAKTGKLIDKNDLRESYAVVSPDGRYAAVWEGDGKRVQVVKLGSGKKDPDVVVAELETDIGRGSVKFSPDGRLLVAGPKGEMQLWDIEKKKISQRLVGLGMNDIMSWGIEPEFSADGRYVAVMGIDPGKAAVFGVEGEDPSSIRVWDTETGKQVAAFKNEGTSHHLGEFRMSDDGKRIIATESLGHRLHVFDIPGNKRVSTMSLGKDVLPHGLSISADGSMAWVGESYFPPFEREGGGEGGGGAGEKQKGATIRVVELDSGKVRSNAGLFPASTSYSARSEDGSQIAVMGSHHDQDCRITIMNTGDDKAASKAKDASADKLWEQAGSADPLEAEPAARRLASADFKKSVKDQIEALPKHSDQFEKNVTETLLNLANPSWRDREKASRELLAMFGTPSGASYLFSNKERLLKDKKTERRDRFHQIEYIDAIDDPELLRRLDDVITRGLHTPRSGVSANVRALERVTRLVAQSDPKRAEELQKLVEERQAGLPMREAAAGGLKAGTAGRTAEFPTYTVPQNPKQFEPPLPMPREKRNPGSDREEVSL